MRSSLCRAEPGEQHALAMFFSCALMSVLALAPSPPSSAAARSRDVEVAALARELTAVHPATRRSAVKQLAALDRPPAWKHVIAALDDREPEVADEAQFQLGGLTDARVLRGLLGREGLGAQDPWRRLRVAEAFGRMRVPIEGEDLLGAIARADPALSRTLLWSVERLALAGLLAGEPARLCRKLEQACERPFHEEVRAAALCALAAHDPHAARTRLSAALRERSERLRCAALSLGRLLDPLEALDAARRLAADESGAVRAQAIELLGELRSRAALSLLIERLEQEARPRLRWRALELLQGASGMKHRFDPRPWRLWLSQLPEDWAPGEGEEHLEPGGSTVAFAGLPILSDRVALLIDFSGSLWHERPEKGKRKDAVDLRLRELLPSFTEATEFNVVPYTSEPLPWKDRIVPATAQNVRSALAYFSGCQARGKGNFFDAALWALRDTRVDTIVVLTDGVPTGGRRWKLELMMPLLAEEVRFRRVAFDSIVVDAPPRVRKHWEWLARATGGRSIALEL